jgi:CDP-diacylglycerol pyrophosphatase
MPKMRTTRERRRRAAPVSHRWCRLLVAAGLIAPFSGAVIGTAHADPDALWTIVHDRCVPDQQQGGDPAPCAWVNLSSGKQNGYAVLKDIAGTTQYLLIPTSRITGIESPAILAPDATNYFAAAWRARYFVEERAGRTLPRDWVSLAINSEVGRSQNQLHIHIDCIRADVHEELTQHAAEIRTTWAPFPVPLADHRYNAIAVNGDDLDAVNPFTLLADGIAGARTDMGLETLVVVGAIGADGRPGFIVLASHADAAAGDAAAGEELQDHTSCPPPPATSPLTPN